MTIGAVRKMRPLPSKIAVVSIAISFYCCGLCSDPVSRLLNEAEQAKIRAYLSALAEEEDRFANPGGLLGLVQLRLRELNWTLSRAARNLRRRSSPLTTPRRLPDRPGKRSRLSPLRPRRRRRDPDCFWISPIRYAAAATPGYSVSPARSRKRAGRWAREYR